MTGRLRVGCSGYRYDDWRGRFYPEHLAAHAWLEWYAREFDAVELNSTHYGTPSASTVAGWRGAVPADFRFAVKLHRFGSHQKKLLDPASWTPRSIEPVEQLGSRAGPMLLQLPPRWRPRLDRLDAALAQLMRSAPRRRRVVEVRDPRWLGPELTAVLRRRRTALCHHDLLDMDGLGQLTASFAYLRFHGPDRSRPYHGSYSTRSLRGTARKAASLLAQGRDVYAFFNNDVGAIAPGDAARFRSLVEDEVRAGAAP